MPDLTESFSPQTNNPDRKSIRPIMMLIAGAVLGLLLVATNLFQEPDEPSSEPAEGAIATVNGFAIPAGAYGGAIERYALNRGGYLDGADSTFVLDSLIDEELLVQRARELGIDRNDRLVRDLMSKTVLDVVAMEAESTPPDAAAVEEFYDLNRDVFAGDPRVRVRESRWEVNSFRTVEQVRDLAMRAAERLRNGEDFQQVNREMGDRLEKPLPDQLLTPSELRRHLGAVATDRALELEAGQVSEPIRSGSSFRVLLVVEREAPDPRPLVEVEDLVRAEMRRRAHQGAIGNYLEDLRARADIRVLPQ